MIKTTVESSIHVAFFGKLSELNDKSFEKIKKTFKRLFGSQALMVSNVEDVSEQVKEIVYEIKTPIIQDENMLRDFFDKLESLFNELKDFSPCFTSYTKPDRKVTQK